MKFARYLEENAVVEWRKVYINYRGLKKLIKKVDARHKARLSKELLRQTSRSSSTKKGLSLTLGGLRKRTSARDEGGDDYNRYQDSDFLTSEVQNPNYGGTGNGAGLADDEGEEEDDTLPPVSLTGTGLALVSFDSHFPRDSTGSDGTKVSSAEEGSGSSGFISKGSKGKGDVDIEANATNSSTTTSRAPVPGSMSRENNVSSKSAISQSNEEQKKNGKKNNKKKKGNKRTRNLESLETIVMDNFDSKERLFFGALDNELERIVAFYEARESDMAKRYEMLARQLEELADHRREYKASQHTQETWTDLGSRLSHLVPLTQPVQALKRSSLHLNRTPNSHNAPLPPHNEAEESKDDEDDPHVVDQGDKRRAEALSRMLNVGGGALSDAEDAELRNANKAAAQSHDPERYKAARKKLKAAVLEYYRGLEILKNYKILNRTGFAKILKKFEKTTEVHVADAYYSSKVTPSILVRSESVEKLLKGTEEIFTAYFEHGNRKRALERLRVNATGGAGAEHSSTHHLSVARAGFYLGISLCAVIGGLIEAMKAETQQSIPLWPSLLRVYGAEFIPTFFSLLFGLNLAIWHRARVNTVFIFEWDVRHALDYHQYFEMPAFFLLLLSLAFWVSFLNPFPDAIAPTTWPLVWLVVVLLILLDPLPINKHYSRRWLITSLARVFQGGLLYGVEFRDFFLGDELNSISWSISMLWFMGCEYNTKWAYPDQCDPNKTYWTAVLLAVPAFLRFVQCFRRFIDSQYTARLHLINAGKYASSIFYYFFYIHYRYNGSHRTQDLALWCVFGTIYSIYTSSWDILMDWSLLRRHARYPWLRNELVFESFWPVYYWAIVTNILLRFGWIIYLLPGPASNLTRIFIIAFLEMLRRFQWNFLRLENEHLGNVDMYRISREIPLPYHFKPDRSKLDDDDEEDEEADKKKKPAFGPKALLRLKTAVNKGPTKTSLERVDESTSADRIARRNTEEGAVENRVEEAAATSDSIGSLDKGKKRFSLGEEEEEDEGNTYRNIGIGQRIREHLVPDHGGIGLVGANRIDDMGAAKGATARDYEPRRTKGTKGQTDFDSSDEDD